MFCGSTHLYTFFSICLLKVALYIYNVQVLADLRVLFVRPVLKPELQQGVIHPLRRTGVHLNHVFQEGFQLPWVVRKYWDELLRIGLNPKQTWDSDFFQ